MSGRTLQREAMRSGHGDAAELSTDLETAELPFIEYDLDALFSFGTFDAEVDARQLHIFEYGQLVDQVKTLEYETDITFAQVGAFAFIEMRYFSSVE